jgi:hypothetical protein
MKRALHRQKDLASASPPETNCDDPMWEYLVPPMVKSHVEAAHWIVQFSRHDRSSFPHNQARGYPLELLGEPQSFHQSGISIVTPATYTPDINAPACSHAVEAQNIRSSLH